jgi:hypothetical protein
VLDASTLAVDYVIHAILLGVQHEWDFDRRWGICVDTQMKITWTLGENNKS